MKKNIFIQVLILSLIISFGANAQIRKANDLFKLYRYAKAIPKYEKVVESGNKAEVKEATQRLADCYRLINDIGQAKVWYTKALDFDDPDPIIYYHLGTVSRGLGEYENAAEAFKKFEGIYPDSLNAARYYDYCINIQPWLSLPETAEIKNVEMLNSKYSDFGPELYNNKILITSDRQLGLIDENTYDWTNFSYLDLYQADPEYYNSFFGGMSKPEKLKGGFNQQYHDGPAAFSSDYSTVFLTRTIAKRIKKDKENIRTSQLKIFYANIVDGKAKEFTPFVLNSDRYSVGHPTLSEDNTTMIFSCDMPGSIGGSDLYLSKFVNGNWQEPINLGDSINTEGNEVFPFWLNDSTLYFASDGHLGFGGLDLFRVENVNDLWQSPKNLKRPINSSYDDFSILVTDDEQQGLFSSNRPEGLGSDDIYAFRTIAVEPEVVIPTPVIASAPVVKPVEKALTMRGYVKDKRTLEPIGMATVFMLDTRNSMVKVLKTDNSGMYETEADRSAFYILKGMKNGYIYDCTSIWTPGDVNLSEFMVPQDLLLDKIEVGMVITVENIYYDLDKWFIRDDAKPSLNKLVQFMEDYPITAELSSHTDCRASDQYNRVLSQKRADAAVDYIMLRGIDTERITAKGYGETRLVNRCEDGVYCTEEEHQANRRTEFKITSIDSELHKDAFNPDLFKEGQVFNAGILEKDFFDNCLKTKNKVEIAPSTNASYATDSNKSNPQKERPALRAGEKSNNGFKAETTPIKGFRVQIMASTKKVNPDTYFMKIEDILEKYGITVVNVDGLFKYQIGNLSYRAEARELQKELIARGFKKCFIVFVDK